MESQPTDSSCGPTCLKAIYDYYDLPIDIEKVIREVKTLQTGGTLEVCLGIHALDHGFDATLYTFNLEVFDPTWFFPKPIEVVAKLRLRRSFAISSTLYQFREKLADALFLELVQSA